MRVGLEAGQGFDTRRGFKRSEKCTGNSLKMFLLRRSPDRLMGERRKNLVEIFWA
jgi:hypothetical protein